MTDPQPTWGWSRLPREIRDQIYEYAMYEPNGLYYWRTGTYSSQFTAEPGSCVAFNQLQYTSRQLRQETLHQEYKPNVLNFPQSTVEKGKTISKSPTRQFIGFLEMCEKSERESLRKVRLIADFSPSWRFSIDARDNDDCTEIARFCEYYPKLGIWWRYECGGEGHIHSFRLYKDHSCEEENMWHFASRYSPRNP